MEYYNNILCISANELIRNDYNPEGFISKSNYDKMARNHRLNNGGSSIKVVRRACYGQPALIEFDSIPSRYREEIKSVKGDPREKAAKKPFVDKIVTDQQALAFFNEYLLEDGRHLPEEVIREYTNDASILNNALDVFEKMKAARKSLGKRISKSDFFQNAANSFHDEQVIKRYPHTLPKSSKGIQRRFKQYLEQGYIGLISGKWCNQNTAKISPEAGEWLIARWATPIGKLTLQQLLDAYNTKAAQEGWKAVGNVNTLHNFLYRPDIQEQWYGMRHGELKYKEKYTRQHRTKLPTCRDAQWYSDGTKLNYYYLETFTGKNGKKQTRMATCQVYEVIDVYSEKLLGYHISKSEDYEAQYHGFKMAIKTAGFKPYELKYDGQGGHKKLTSQNFLDKIAHITSNTQPYNGKSKTIENVFYRLQAQFLHKDWFFTGQNIQAKKLESKVNMEYMMANKDKLPTLEEVKAIYAKRREEWNNAKHHKTGMSRNETYMLSTNPKAEKVEMWDMIDLFWLTTEKPSTYRASGLQIQVKNEKYAYEVLDEFGQPDTDFLRANVDRKFYVKYDPYDMTMVRLYEKDASGSLRFVTIAQPYVKVHRATQDQVESDNTFIKAQEIVNKRQRVDAQANIEQIMEKHGLHPEQHGMKMPKIKGVSKKLVESFGEYTKAVSQAVPVDDEGKDIYDLM